MVRKKQVNNQNGAVLNRDFPRRGRSLIIGAEELRRLFPNVKPNYIDLAIKRFDDYRFGDALCEIEMQLLLCYTECEMSKREACIWIISSCGIIS